MTQDSGDEALTRITTHEAVCVERYKGIQSRLGRIEFILIGCTAALLWALLKDKIGL